MFSRFVFYLSYQIFGVYCLLYAIIDCILPRLYGFEMQATIHDHTRGLTVPAASFRALAANWQMLLLAIVASLGSGVAVEVCSDDGERFFGKTVLGALYFLEVIIFFLVSFSMLRWCLLGVSGLRTLWCSPAFRFLWRALLFTFVQVVVSLSLLYIVVWLVTEDAFDTYFVPFADAVLYVVILVLYAVAGTWLASAVCDEHVSLRAAIRRSHGRIANTFLSLLAWTWILLITTLVLREQYGDILVGHDQSIAWIAVAGSVVAAALLVLFEVVCAIILARAYLDAERVSNGA